MLKYLKHIGPPSFRAAMIDWLPVPELKRLRNVVVKMDSEAKNIYAIKKGSLKAGEESVLRQVGEGKDIMSILREFDVDHFRAV